MKAVALTDIRQFEIIDVPEPEIKKDDDVLLKIEIVGVCGSDVHYYETGRIGSQVVKFPYIIGHECSATVKAIGNKVGRVKLGDKVAVDPAVSCHKCDQCKKGRENTCRNLRFLGTPGQGDGCLCEYIVMPQDCVFPVNKKITLEQAVLVEPGAISLYAVKQANIAPASDVAVLGAGPIGLGCLCFAAIHNINACYVTEKIDERVEAAKKAGASWVGNPLKLNIVREISKLAPAGLDVVFECAGKPETIDQTVELLKPGGKLMLVGIPREERISFVIDKLRRKEITVINIRRQNHCTQECIDLLAAKKVNLDFMITHRFPIDQVQDAFEMVAGYRNGVVKALIQI